MLFKSLESNISKRFLWWVFVAGYFMFVYMPRFLMEGMFGDGLTYSSIARNMAIGRGTFWEPYFSSSFWLSYNSTIVFYEHPPLAMYLQSLLFKVFGDQLFVEKIYSFFICLLTVVAISLIWRLVLRGTELKNWDWLPAIIWLGMPEVDWTVPNNMLDNTQALFCILAVYFYLISVQEGKLVWFSVLSGVCIFLGFLSKGPVSLFVIGIPLLYYFIIDKKNKVFFRGAVFLGLGFLVPLVFCILDADAYSFLNRYIHQQFLSALLGKREITEGGTDVWAHLHIFKAIYTQVSPALILIFIGFVIVLIKKRFDFKGLFVKSILLKKGLFFILLATAGSFPIALSLKQADYYLLPSTTLYALGLGMFFVYFIEKFNQNGFQVIPKVWWIGIVFVVFSISVVFASSFIGSVRKYEKDIVHDLPLIHKYVPDTSKIWVCNDMMTDFNIHTYLQRYYRYELTENSAEAIYFLVQSGCNPPEGLNIVQLKEPFEKFALYQLKQ